MKVEYLGILPIAIGLILIVFSLPFLSSAERDNPNLNPLSPPLPVARSASATFGLPDIRGQFQGQYGEITYTIVSTAITPGVPLRVAAKVEIPMLLAAEWNVDFISIRLDNAVQNGWPIINGTKQAEIFITSWEKATPSIFLYSAWASSDVLNFTSEGFVGGLLEISWLPACWGCFDWTHLGNLTDIKIPTTTSLTITSQQEADAPLQTQISLAWDNYHRNFDDFLYISLTGIGSLVAGITILAQKEVRRRRSVRRIAASESRLDQESRTEP
jgi:hypothetical protein